MFVYACIDRMVLWQRPLALAVIPYGPFRYMGTLAVAVALAVAAEATVVAGGGGGGDGDCGHVHIVSCRSMLRVRIHYDCVGALMRAL